MRLKMFHASGMTEAMARVRLELGPDALILATRRLGDGVEVTAALEEEDAPPPLAAAPPLPPDPVHATALAYHGVPSSLTQRLAGRLAVAARTERRGREAALAAALASELRFDELGIAAGAPPLLLVGPPGAGKTLTVARLATRLVLAHSVPLVITADGRRAGAVEQLAAFTRLLGLTLLAADHPLSLGRALARRPPGAPVLIDAPGIDPFDPAQRDELAALAATATARIALVLPAGMDAAECADLAGAFGELGATMLIATRLDIARRIGGLLAAADAASLTMTEAGTGPGAADSLVALGPAYLAARLIQTAPARVQPGEMPR